MDEIVEPVDFLHWQRARSYQAHFPAQGIPKLGQLVEAVSAQNTAQAGDEGLLAILNIGPSISFWAASAGLSSSAATFIERNFYIVNGCPFKPARYWR